MTFAAKLLLTGLVLAAAAIFVACCAPPDTRSWEQVLAEFIADEAEHANDGERDGRRLKALDRERAAAFLIPFLDKSQPYGFRLKAIGALGWGSFNEAVPALSAIASGEAEDEKLRAAALNPGLRYMDDPQAMKTASSLATSDSVSVSRSAYWVLSGYGNDEAINILAERLRSKDTALLTNLIYALESSEHPRAGQIIFDLVDFSSLPDEQHLHAYAIAMARYRIPAARENMLFLIQQESQPLSCYYALRYFGFFPSNDVVPVFVSYIKADKAVSDLYDTVSNFIESLEISSSNKLILTRLIESGKVKQVKMSI